MTNKSSPEDLMRKAAYERLITRFVLETNRIEGIDRTPTKREIDIHRSFIARNRLKIDHITDLVNVCQPGAALRDRDNVSNVQVGSYTAPRSGPEIVKELNQLIVSMRSGSLTPWAAHVAYEKLHPYTDGNGRSGRALWLWHMTMIGQQERALRLGFLHTFYYQTLAHHSSSSPIRGLP